MPQTEARDPGQKPPRWSAERRASRVVSAFTRVLRRTMGRRAPRKRPVCRGMAGPPGAAAPGRRRRSAPARRKQLISIDNVVDKTGYPRTYPNFMASDAPVSQIPGREHLTPTRAALKIARVERADPIAGSLTGASTVARQGKAQCRALGDASEIGASPGPPINQEA